VKAIPRFPDSIVQAAANAIAEIITDIREMGDALTKKTVESFIASLTILKIKTNGADAQFIEARNKYFKL
jgi:hypothetical protein